ncbi:MAG: c-type cytochrome [Paracoccus sp. (in: a-proteobacteria)]|uniref:c-type cytochrome n=1 Tax=Paracoccus sp. TaxID=267 RepID=UPI0026E099E7|nr:c-type cytochrome [Paracoccus sp. (in: a-proteobacteria)]MDO5621420.1 c-type cytochrome [Paracoccus sp. (in: a-proteobacteria)]
MSLRSISSPCLCAAALILAPVAGLAQDAPEVDLTTWQTGNIDDLPDDDYGRLVRYGFQLATETYAHIGPEVADPAMRYAGNNLACTSCHQDNATKPYAMPWTGVTAVFPQYRARENTLQSVEERVNGCMERSMAGKPLPLDSPEMRGFTAYIHFLSRGIPVGATVKGSGVERVAAPDRAADPVAGKLVYDEQCAVCHGEDGLGQRNGEAGDAQGYLYPAVMGDDSYNDGAGMYRVLMAYRFILNNMPQGADYTARQLDEDQAYDVAAYLSSLPRGSKAGMENDFPDLLRKAPDMPFAPWAGDFPAEQHKYGPFKPIADWQAAQVKARTEAEAAEKAAQ